MPSLARSAWCGWAGWAVCVLLACKPPAGNPEGTPDATASPQASAMPAPLAAATTTASALVVATPEGGPPPSPFRGDVALGPDTLGRETAGYTLSAVLKQSDVSAPPRALEVNVAGLDAARKKTELKLAIDLSSSRMRVALLGSGWVVPPDTELRARSDHYGHVVVWPGALTYRPLPPGALRALLGERRLDAAPMTPADIVAKDDVGKRIAIRTRRVEVATRAAKATFEIGRLPDLGEGGILLCRMLLDLMSAPPWSVVCGEGELPVRVELRWTGHGSLVYELTGVLKKPDMPTASLFVPPAGAAFAGSPLSASGVQVMLSPAELAAFRTGPIELPTMRATGNDLAIANATDQLRVLHVDGIPVAWAAPSAHDVIRGLHRGRYVTQWRTFLGDNVEPSLPQTVPGATQVGGPDAGR